jgi:hypothetical protein
MTAGAHDLSGRIAGRLSAEDRTGWYMRSLKGRHTAA